MKTSDLRKLLGKLREQLSKQNDWKMQGEEVHFLVKFHASSLQLY